MSGHHSEGSSFPVLGKWSKLLVCQ